MILSWLRKRKARQFNEAKGWLWAGSVAERQVDASWPVDFWTFDWQDCGVVRLLDPLYGKQKVLREYWVFNGDMRYAFAAAKFSNGIYGFFLPATGGIKDIGADPKLRDLSNVPRNADGDPHFPLDAAALPPLLREAEGSCMACGKQQERLYQGPLYTRCSREVELCLDCIASGRAAVAYDGEFNDIVAHFEGVAVSPSAEVAEDILNEIRHHTPGYETWQGNGWIFHCGDGAQFRGDATVETIANASEESKAAFAEQNPHNSWDELMADYRPGTGLSVYHFTCRHCGVDLFLWDCD